MTNIRNLAPAQPEAATNAGKFLATRGHVVMKEFREFGKIRCDYGSTLTISSLIFAIAQGQGGQRTFGLKIEHKSQDDYEESCLLDFDELKELLLAIKHLLKLAKEISSQPCDYTEFEYVSRDSLKVGFFQEPTGRQQAFFDVSPGGSIMFVTFDELRRIFEVIKSGREHLIEKGAGSDTLQ